MIEGYQKRPRGFMMKDGSPMPRCKRLECVEKMKTFELSEAYQDTSERGHDTPAGGEGADEVNKVQFRERWTKRRNTMMMTSEQQIHEAQVLKRNKVRWKNKKTTMEESHRTY